MYIEERGMAGGGGGGGGRYFWPVANILKNLG